MKYLFACLFILCSSNTYSQSIAMSPEQTTRLAQFAKLYGHIKFFHPYTGYKNIQLDSAFAQAAARLMEADTEQKQADALQQFLKVLGDPATTVILKNTEQENLQVGTAGDSLQFYFDKDSILIIKTNNYYGFDNYVALLQQLETIKTWAKSATGLMLDMRAFRPVRSDVLQLWPFCFDYSGLSSLFLTHPVNTFGQRLRMHSGFTPETSGTSGGYFSGYYTKSGAPIQPASKPLSIPVAVIINSNSDVPSHALPLSQAPGCALFVAGSMADGSLAEKTEFEFSPALKVKIRLSEVIDPQGNPGIGKYQHFPESAGWEAPERAALAFLKGKSPQYAHPEQAGTGSNAAPTAYDKALYPSPGYRLLAAAKIWSIIHYFFAYKELIPGDWDQTLVDHLPAFVRAKDSLEYARAVARMYRNIQDGHGIIASPVLREYFGTATAPFTVRFIENKAVITSVWVDSIAQKAGISRGDVILEVNGEKTAARAQRIGALLNASNEWTRDSYIARRMLLGRDGDSLSVRILDKNKREKTVRLPLRKNYTAVTDRAHTDTIRILPGNIGYADLGRLSGEEVGKMFDRLKDTRAIIFDMRGYPNGTAWQIAPRLSHRSNIIAATFSRYTPTGPDLFFQDASHISSKYFFSQHIPSNFGLPVYEGKTLMLIDERTQSQAEHTGLFFEAANGTEFVGSPTAGANGDVTNFQIPGNMTLSFSGHSVRHADGRQLQQTGLQPKILVKPGVKGIREGKDEVLEAAIRYLQQK